MLLTHKYSDSEACHHSRITHYKSHFPSSARTRGSYICLTRTLNSSHFRLDGCQTTNQAASTLPETLKNDANLEN